MLIEVIRCDNRCDSVEESMLETLIKTQDIIKFKRGTEWVTIGEQPIRKQSPEEAFKDKERSVAQNSSFEGQVRKASSSSLEPF